MTITILLFQINIRFVWMFFGPQQPVVMMGPIYQPTDPATAPHRAEPMYDTDAR